MPGIILQKCSVFGIKLAKTCTIAFVIIQHTAHAIFDSCSGKLGQ